MDTTMTTWNTEIFGALAMSALPTHPIVAPADGKDQGTTVSTPSCALTGPAYDSTVAVLGFGDRFGRIVAPTQTTDVATPRLLGPPV